MIHLVDREEVFLIHMEVETLMLVMHTLRITILMILLFMMIMNIIMELNMIIFKLQTLERRELLRVIQ